MSLIDDLPRSGQVLSTCTDIFDEAAPIFFRDLTINVDRDGLVPEHWTYARELYSFAPHIRNMCIDINLHDLYNFRDRTTADYSVIMESITTLELTCAALKWRRGAHFLSNTNPLKARPSFKEAWEVMSTIVMLFLVNSKLNHVTNLTTAGREIHFVLKHSNDVSVSARELKAIDHADRSLLGWTQTIVSRHDSVSEC